MIATGPLDLIRHLSDLRLMVDDTLAQQYLALALRRLTLVYDDNLMRGVNR
jgi:hypothetical protein